jgi:hypothetical protein
LGQKIGNFDGIGREDRRGTERTCCVVVVFPYLPGVNRERERERGRARQINNAQ